MLLAFKIVLASSLVVFSSPTDDVGSFNLKRTYPPNSPKGPRYCHNEKEFKCLDPKRNTLHLFCGCHKYRCESYEPENMTSFREYMLFWHNRFREIISMGLDSPKKQDLTIATGEKLPVGYDLRAMTYNYNMEDGARCSAKKCVVPILHDHCHATPQFRDGSGQNIAVLGPEALRCRFRNARVKDCNLNEMDEHEAVFYVAARTWFEELKNIQNLSIIDRYALPAFPELPFSPKEFKQYANFVSMVWAESDKVGCAVAKPPESDTGRQFFYVTCHYHPIGNILGQPVYSKTPAECPDELERHVSEHYELCGEESVPPEPPLDFFISISKSKQNAHEHGEVLRGRNLGASPGGGSRTIGVSLPVLVCLFLVAFLSSRCITLI